MDTLRGTFESDGNGDHPDIDDIHDPISAVEQEPDEGEAARDLPPSAIGQDERRMQVRAYNHWASLLGERTFPSIEDLEPADLPDFGPYSVLLDFSAGIDDPVIQYLGGKLAHECGATTQIQQLSDVPPRSLLSRITDHYLQIMANQAPIGFEAEFVNQRGAAILYRGILLPFSSDDESIDFIFGVINWKEMADSQTADELLLEIDQALETQDEDFTGVAQRHHSDDFADWADSPAHEAGESEDLPNARPDMIDDNILDLGVEGQEIAGPHDTQRPKLPMPDFGQYTLDDPDEDPDEYLGEDDSAGYSFASLADYIEAPSKKAIDLDAEKFDPADYEVGDEPHYDSDDAPIPVPYEPEGYEPEDYNPLSYQTDNDGSEAFQPEPSFPPEVPSSEPVHVFAVEQTQDASEPSVSSLDNTVSPAALEDGGENEAKDVVQDGCEPAPDLPENASIHDCLASARELARSARASEDRSRQALYCAVGRAYDFSLAASDAPDDYEALIEESGLTVQDRAPMTPVVKLVFGGDYDKTRLTEYAAVLSHAHRLKLERGALADYLIRADGGLKGVVTAERRLRREESGKPVEPEHAIREALAKKLRELEALSLEALSVEGPEFALVMVRRDGTGRMDVLGEIADDTALVERAARKLVG